MTATTLTTPKQSHLLPESAAEHRYNILQCYVIELPIITLPLGRSSVSSHNDMHLSRAFLLPTRSARQKDKTTAHPPRYRIEKRNICGGFGFRQYEIEGVCFLLDLNIPPSIWVSGIGVWYLYFIFRVSLFKARSVGFRSPVRPNLQ